MEITMKLDRSTWLRASGWTWLLPVLLALALFAHGARAATPAQTTFATPEDAVAALVQAAKANDRAAFRAVLGHAPGAISSGDPVADRALGAKFVAEYDAKHAIVRDGDTAKLTIGTDDFPFAFPLVKDGDKWRFDTAAGKDELLARRIGENELVRDQGDAGDRRRATGVRIRRPRRRRRARLRAQVRERQGQARRTVLADEGRRAAEPAGRARRAARPAKATRPSRASPRPTTATTTGC